MNSGEIRQAQGVAWHKGMDALLDVQLSLGLYPPCEYNRVGGCGDVTGQNGVDHLKKGEESRTVFRPSPPKEETETMVVGKMDGKQITDGANTFFSIW